MKKRYKHDLSNYHLLGTDAGRLTPVKIVECLPNDSFEGQHEGVIRLSALKRPVMHPLRVKTFTFFHPTRLAWPDGDKFITQGAYGSTPPVAPYITLTDSGGAKPLTSTLNNMGQKFVPNGQTRKINAIPVSCWNNIINKFFIDQDIGTLRARSDVSGDRTTLEDTTDFYVNWKKDYFTTARPWAQKSPSIPILNSQIPVNRYNNAGATVARAANSNTIKGAGDLLIDGSGDLESSGKVSLDLNNTHYANGDAAGNVPDLRMRTALQRFFENRADYGSRLIEYLRQSFGAKVRDSVLQNPELVHYTEKTIHFSEVLQTAEGEDPVGTLRGHGVGGFKSDSYKYYCQEHGYLITMCYVMPEPMYVEAMERFWFKDTFSEYFQQEFEAIGEQPIYQAEINGVFIPGTAIKDTWGWTHRYDEYRRCLHQISGSFESPSLDLDWHYGRTATETQVLNDTFLRFPPTERVFQDAEEASPYKIMYYNRLVARRNVKRHVRKRIL